MMMTSAITEAALFLSRSPELSILARTTMMLAAGLTVPWLSGRSRAAVRHVVLGAIFGTLATLPLIVLTGPALRIEVPVLSSSQPARDDSAVPSPSTPSSIAADARRSDPSPTLSWPRLVRFVWTAGAIAFLMPLP